ncbi:short-chain dehydrogenase/reductase SDR [Pseudomonas sp. FH1]|nr:short-chain dehydrogenase/reductase SDR [Pseudomonas sp. FH1]
MTQSLKGKVALVTGASRGIGAAIALRLAAEGADVAFSYSRSAERAQAVLRGIKAYGVKGLAVAADQADGGAVAALVRTVHEHFGRLDILVNSAGVFSMGVVGDPTADTVALDRQQAINLNGVVAAVRAAVPLMADGRWRSHRIDRHHVCQSSTFCRCRGLCRQQGSRGGVRPRLGTGPGAARDHGQHRAAGAHQYRNEPRNQRHGAAGQADDRIGSLWPAGRNRRCGGVFVRCGRRLYHRCHAECRRRAEQLIMPPAVEPATPPLPP